MLQPKSQMLNTGMYYKDFVLNMENALKILERISVLKHYIDYWTSFGG